MLHRSPFIWIAIALAALLAIFLSQAAAMAFVGVYLIVDGLNIVRTKVVDLGDWQGNDTAFVIEGLLAQLFGVMGIAAGVYLFLASGILSVSVVG